MNIVTSQCQEGSFRKQGFLQKVKGLSEWDIDDWINSSWDSYPGNQIAFAGYKIVGLGNPWLRQLYKLCFNNLQRPVAQFLTISQKEVRETRSINFWIGLVHLGNLHTMLLLSNVSKVHMQLCSVLLFHNSEITMS